MIKSFKSEQTEGIFRGRLSRKLPQDIQRVAARKLEQLSAAARLDTLRVPPGNRLEALTRDRQGTAQPPGERSMARVLYVA